MQDLSKEDEDEDDLSLAPPKRIKIEDVNISRYSEEFLEVAEIANGEFGKVTVARHRLDGMLYAIKVGYFISVSSTNRLDLLHLQRFLQDCRKMKPKPYCFLSR